jgi:hypothetical protein
MMSSFLYMAVLIHNPNQNSSHSCMQLVLVVGKVVQVVSILNCIHHLFWRWRKSFNGRGHELCGYSWFGCIICCWRKA